MSIIDLQRLLSEQGFVALPASSVRSKLSFPAEEERGLTESFEALPQDRQMGDGGRYRYRRFNKFSLAPGEELRLSQDTSIHQSLMDNQLNGGVTRTFEPLDAWTRNSQILKALLKHDMAVLKSVEPELFEQRLIIGVHQVRIVAEPSSEGQPTPEGIHRDAERYTFQHFWDRDGVDGGEFVAYDQTKAEVFRWLQSERLDSVLFCGTTWHSATPIKCSEEQDRGHRDIFLIDFDPV